MHQWSHFPFQLLHLCHSLAWWCLTSSSCCKPQFAFNKVMWDVKKIHKTIYLFFLISVPTANTLTLETIRLIHLTNFSGWIYRPLVSDKNTRTLEYVTHFSAVSQSNAEPQDRDIAAKEKLTGRPFMLCHCACYAEFEWHIDLDYWYALLSIFFIPGDI